MLLSPARRTLVSRWICLSCRRASITTSAADRPLSKAAQELREIGPCRTRFAPSPTGYLHLGSLRTALFNYLIAKATGGQFLLRIEDTDQKRTVPDAEQRLYKDLEWAGIEWDEGPKIGGEYGPYKQSQRTAIYREHVEQLLYSGNAYRCFCTPQRLLYLAKHRESLGQQPDYDRKCAHIQKEESDDRAAKGEAHVVRLMAPDKSPVYNDLVFGRVRQRGELQNKAKPVRGSYYNSAHPGSYYDPILMKSDGFPTYHLANVVDDHLMKITHVIRGSEWMSSTPKHLELYQAFGWEPPAFAHVSLLVDKNGAKLSKRTGSIDLSELRDKQGVFPGTLNNFAALLGWSHHNPDDFMEMEDLIRRASLKFTRGDTKVDFGKLWYLQRKHAQHYASLDPSTVDPRRDLNLLAVKPIMNYFEGRRSRQKLFTYEALQPGAPRENFVRSLLLGDVRNYTSPEEFINRSISFFSPPTKDTLQTTIPIWNWKLRHIPRETDKNISPAEFLELLEVYEQIPEKTWNKEELKFWTDTIIKSMLMKSIDETPGLREDEAVTLRFQKAWSAFLHKYIRWATMGARSGPDGSVAMSILGREETLRRFGLAKEVVLEKYGEDGEVRRDDDTADGALMTGMLMGGMAGTRVPSGGAAEPAPGLTEGAAGGVSSEGTAASGETGGLVEDKVVPDEEDVFLEDEAQHAEESSWGWGEADGDGGDGGDF